MGKFWNRIAKRLDSIGYGIIDLITLLLDKIRPGWSVRNKSRIDEWKLMIYAFNRSILGVIGLILVIAFFFLGIFGPSLAAYKYNEYPLVYLPKLARADPGQFGFILGTDEMGRDLLSLLLYGARVSLILSFLVILISMPFGVILGLVSGYFGGKVDEVIQRITDIFYAFPGLVLALALAAVLVDRIQPFIMNNPVLKDLTLVLFAGDVRDIGSLVPFFAVIIAIAVVGWPGYTRLVRGLVLSIRENVYVEAARSLGLSSWGILRKHILPNVFSVIIVMVTFDLAGIVIFGAAMSFLGIGLQDPFVDWGKLVYQGYRYFPEEMHLVVYPGLTLFIVGLGWTFLGDTLRDVLDPTTRRRIEVLTKEEKIYLGDWLNFVGSILILAGLVYGGMMIGDAVIILAIIMITLVSYILLKIIEYFVGAKSYVKAVSCFPLILYGLNMLFNIHIFITSLIFAISIVLYSISPMYVKTE